MIVELSPASYKALCGLVQDALEHPSDATLLLRRVARELAGATANDAVIPEALQEHEKLRLVSAG